MVGVVSLIPKEGKFIFTDFETLQCEFCTKIPEMSDLCYLGKTHPDHPESPALTEKKEPKKVPHIFYCSISKIF